MVMLVAGAVVGAAAPAGAAEPGHGRHYEVATPADKLGQPTDVSGLSDDGSTLRFIPSAGGLPGTEGQNGVFSSYVARRDASRWSYFPMSLPVTVATRGFYLDAAPSLDVQLFRGTTDSSTRAASFFVRRLGMPPESVSLPLVSRGAWLPPRDSPLFAGASADLKHIVFTAPGDDFLEQEVAYLASDPQPEPDDGSGYRRSPQKLYESVAGPPGALRRVDVDNGGVPIGGSCEGNGLLQVNLGTVNLAERAVSADGDRIFFTTSPDCVDRRLYARLDGATTVELSASECERVADPVADPPVTECASRSGSEEYESASTVGNLVYFTSTNQLVDSDTDAERDAYRYDFDAPSGSRLRLISRATGPTPETGVDFRGMVRVSRDGGRAYLVAGAVLDATANAQGDEAVAGQSNLYRYEATSSSLRFVATLDPSDDWQLTRLLRPAQLADSHGRFLVFSSMARLTADDTDDAQDVYRYDAEAGQLQRVSAGRDGFGTDGNAAVGATIKPVDNGAARVSAATTVRAASEDGRRVVFLTAEALEAADVNGAPDVYEWADGEVELISDGVTVGGTADPWTFEKGFMISADGSTVAFSTAARLLPERDLDAVSDVYVARLGADVEPRPVPPDPPCGGDGCQPEGEPRPGVSAAGSVTFSGPGNVLTRPAAPGAARVALRKAKAVRGSRRVLTVTVPGSGRLSVRGTGVKALARRTGKAGAYRVVVALDARARRSLVKRRTVRTKVTVTFTSTRGVKARAQVSLTFKAASRKGRA